MDENFGTFVVCHQHPEKGLIFSTDSRSGKKINGKALHPGDNYRKYFIFNPYFICCSGSVGLIRSVLRSLSRKFNKKHPATLEDFSAYILKSIEEEDEKGVSFIIGSVRLEKNGKKFSFADKTLIMIDSDEPGLSVSYGNSFAIGCGDDYRIPFTRNEEEWQSVIQIQNDILRSFARVYFNTESCGGPIEMVTITLEKSGRIHEDHILDFVEILCEERKLKYTRRSKPKKDKSGKVIERAQIQEGSSTLSDKILVNKRKVIGFEKGSRIISVNLRDPIFVDQPFKGQSRLPKFAIPKHYDLKLKPDLIACTFTGTVEINLEVVSDTNFLVLNASQLEFDHSSIYFTNPNTKKYQTLDVNFLEEDEILVLGFAEDLSIGEGSLYIGFKGTLNDQMKGFYRSTYEHNGEKNNMAVTQFEPADARRCFPCWDEPAFKATFKITMEMPVDLMALSNMPIIEDHSDGNLKTVSFQESPIMSTYLVAVVVGLFDYVEDHTADGIKVRVYCQVGKGNQGKFALDVAVKTLGLYTEYFDTPYSLPKLDMVAIPDFAAGARENYGLVTYRETALLYDEQHSVAANKQRVAAAVAHELAHQWFGNLVTMEWWTHLWLKEGFATWVSYLAADTLFPEWNIWTQFLDETADGLTLDGLTESHPIEVEIQHANEIDEIVDAISYEKGASVIRMLQSFLGPECFQRSLASYIKLYACSNAKTEDLWAVLEKESGEPVNKLMNSWTKQQGYPVISVNVRGNKLEFEQSQFMLSGAHGNGEWIVPISLCCGSYDVRKDFLLQTKSDAVDIMELLGTSNAANNTVEKGNHQKWIKLNVDQAGFYRIKYDEELAARLRNAIEANHLSATDRLGILDDSFALSMACKQSLSSLFILISAYKKEHEYTVLSNLITVSRKVAKIAADANPDLFDIIKQFFINLFQYSAERLGWEPQKNESHLDAMLRGEVLTALAVFGDNNTQSEAIGRFRSFLNDRNTPLLPPDTRKAAYVAVMQRASKSNRRGYESLLRIYRETNLSQEKTRVLSSLTSCPDVDIVLEALNFLLSSEVRSQDAVYGLEVSMEGREIAWRWLKDKWDHILKTFGSGYLLTRFVSSIVSPFSSEDKAAEVVEFFASRSKPSMARILKQSLEHVHINENWIKSIQEEKPLAEIVKELTNMKD